MPRTAVALIAVLLSALVAAAPAGGQSEGTLRDRIGSGKQQERSLASAAARLGALERKVSREVAVLEGRLSEAQSELDAGGRQLRRELRRQQLLVSDRPDGAHAAAG